MAPSIGRIVHLFPGEQHRRDIQQISNGNAVPENEPVAAVIVRVWGPQCVNLKVLADGRNDVWLTSVVSRDAASPGSSFWDWPERV